MVYFNCDYTEGAHPKIMDKMAASNLEQTPGYGTDAYCERARALIRKECQAPDAAVHFLVGGTQVNFTVIRAALRPHQGVIAPETGHIHVHETGAVEATGHKILALPCGVEGKITARQVEEVGAISASVTSAPWAVSPSWCTSPNLPRTGPCIPKPSWKPCMGHAGSGGCTYLPTGRAWAMG